MLIRAVSSFCFWGESKTTIGHWLILCIKKPVNYFRKKIPSWMFDWVLNTPLYHTSMIERIFAKIVHSYYRLWYGNKYASTKKRHQNVKWGHLKVFTANFDRILLIKHINIFMDNLVNVFAGWVTLIACLYSQLLANSPNYFTTFIANLIVFLLAGYEHFADNRGQIKLKVNNKDNGTMNMYLVLGPLFLILKRYLPKSNHINPPASHRLSAASRWLVFGVQYIPV